MEREKGRSKEREEIKADADSLENDLVDQESSGLSSIARAFVQLIEVWGLLRLETYLLAYTILCLDSSHLCVFTHPFFWFAGFSRSPNGTESRSHSTERFY
jgi:hypothetical protein